MASLTNLGLDMNPIANPLTSGRISNTFGITNGFSKPKDPSKLSVPDPVMTYGDALAAQVAAQTALTVPDTLPPMKVDYDTYNPGLTQKDIDYWKNAQEKTAELVKNMNDEQKDMLAHIEDFVGKSRLQLDESQKQKENDDGKQ